MFPLSRLPADVSVTMRGRREESSGFEIMRNEMARYVEVHCDLQRIGKG
jgi:hypothetical protein